MFNKVPVLILYDFIFPFTQTKLPINPYINSLRKHLAPKGSSPGPRSIKCLGITKKMERISERRQPNEEKYYPLGSLVELEVGSSSKFEVIVKATECVKLIRQNNVYNLQSKLGTPIILENSLPKDEIYSKDLMYSNESKIYSCFYSNFEKESLKKITRLQAEDILYRLENLQKVIQSKSGLEDSNDGLNNSEKVLKNSRIKRLLLLKTCYEIAHSLNSIVMREAKLLPDWLDFKYDFLKSDLAEKTAKLTDVIRRI